MVAHCVEGADGLHVHDCLLQLKFLIEKDLLPEGVALSEGDDTSACFFTLVAYSTYFFASFFLSAAISSFALFFRIYILLSNFFSFYSKFLILISRSLRAASILIFFSAILSASDLVGAGEGGGAGFFFSYEPKSLPKNDMICSLYYRCF